MAPAHDDTRSLPSLALLFEPDAYITALERDRFADPKAIGNLNGRQVAGARMLEALLRHPGCPALIALTRTERKAITAAQYWNQAPPAANPMRRLSVLSLESGTERFFDEPPASVLHLPNVLESAFAWARRNGRGRPFALSGLTHGMNGTRILQLLADLLLAPFEPYDALVCTSRAAARLVRDVTTQYADYLRDRFGGEYRLRPRLEWIPLGVDTETARPPTADERAAARALLEVRADETVVLMVGRLDFHAKVHPFPLFQALAQTARAARKPIHLVVFGTPSSAEQLAVYRDGAATFAEGVRVTFADGTRSDLARSVWWAADIYSSLSDNTQETFGLSILEAMAAGLPVIATDWDGCRDTISEGETGLLVPTRMIRGATVHVTTRHVLEVTQVGRLLGECNQATAVDTSAATAAFQRLIGDPPLRQRMGKAGRERALREYGWGAILSRWLALWADQARHCEAAARPPEPVAPGPAWFPAPEVTFAGYPSVWLDGDSRLRSELAAIPALDEILRSPLTNYFPETRSRDPQLLRAILEAALGGTSVKDIEALGLGFSADPPVSRATTAWLLKYGLLAPLSAAASGSSE